MSLCQKVLGVLNLLCKVSTWRLAEERNCSKAKSYDSTQLGYENILNVKTAATIVHLLTFLIRSWALSRKSAAESLSSYAF